MRPAVLLCDNLPTETNMSSLSNNTAMFMLHWSDWLNKVHEALRLCAQNRSFRFLHLTPPLTQVMDILTYVGLKQHIYYRKLSTLIDNVTHKDYIAAVTAVESWCLSWFSNCAMTLIWLKLNISLPSHHIKSKRPFYDVIHYSILHCTSGWFFRQYN